MVMPNKNSNQQISKSTNNLNQVNYDVNPANAFPPPPPFVLDSSLAPNSQPLTTSASSNRISPPAAATAACGIEKPTKPSTFSMFAKGFKQIFSADSKSKTDKDKEGFTRENGNYQSDRLGSASSRGNSVTGVDASPVQDEPTAAFDRSNSANQSKSMHSMNEYAIYDEAPPVPRTDRTNSLASGITPTTPASIISNNGSWMVAAKGPQTVYGQQVSTTSTRGLPHSQTSPTLPNPLLQPPVSAEASNAGLYSQVSVSRPTAPPMPGAGDGGVENDELNEIDRLVDFTTNEERMNLQRKGYNILASQIETKKARIVSMEADIVELKHMFDQYRSHDDIERLKHEIRELTNEKATLELRIIQNSSWPCTKCTVLNRSDSVVCEMCGTEKDGGEIIICEKCNEKNPLYKIRCKKCGFHLLRDPNNSNENAEPPYDPRTNGGQPDSFIRPTRPAPPIPPRRTTSTTANPSGPHSSQLAAGTTTSPHSAPNMQTPYTFGGGQPSIPHQPNSASANYNHVNQNVYFNRAAHNYSSTGSQGSQGQPQPSPRGGTSSQQQAGSNNFTRI